MSVRPIENRDRKWIAASLERWWGATRMVSRGVDHDLLALPGFVAEREEERTGLLLYRTDGTECEIVSLNSVWEDRGTGTSLLAAVEAYARGRGAKRIWLVTSNDNLRAVGFYQRRGYRLVAVHRDAIDAARAIRPSIPKIGLHNIPLRDELEFEKLLTETGVETSVI